MPGHKILRAPPPDSNLLIPTARLFAALQVLNDEQHVGRPWVRVREHIVSGLPEAGFEHISILFDLRNSQSDPEVLVFHRAVVAHVSDWPARVDRRRLTDGAGLAVRDIDFPRHAAVAAECPF